MSTKGFVNKDLEPIVKIALVFGKRGVEFPAVIDTGFNGYLSVPFSSISDSDWEFMGYEKYEMANGDIIEEKIFLGKVFFNGKVRQVRVVSSRVKDILIGTRLLDESVLNINFKNKNLTIENA